MSELQHFEKLASTLNLDYIKFTDTIPVSNSYDNNCLDMIINIDSLHRLIS